MASVMFNGFAAAAARIGAEMDIQAMIPGRGPVKDPTIPPVI